MLKKIENIYFVFIFFLTTILVFLSRQLQINFVKKYENIFYVYNEPVFTNPDSYLYFSKIKKILLQPTINFQNYFNFEFLVSLYLILINIFRTLNLTELALVSTPYIIVLVFWSIYLFFSSFINKYAALFISLISCLSNVFLTRSSSLSFDTDPFNIFFYFYYYLF